MSARVGVVSVWHETNGYSRRVAELEQWNDFELLRGSAVAEKHRGTRSVIGGFLDGLGKRAVPVFAAGAWPSGPAPSAVLRELVERLESSLASAGPLDAVALNLHGSMVAGEVDDVEALVARCIRKVQGDLPIAAVLDLHGNPSSALTSEVDALIAYRTYPHVDMWECGMEAVGLIDRMLGGERLTTTIAKVPLLTSPLAQGTDGPIGDVMAELQRSANECGILRASVLAGFAYQDTKRAGSSVLLVSRLRDAVRARELATATASKLVALQAQGAFTIERPSPSLAVEEAMATAGGPVVLADIADNIGAGSAGDGTVVLAELLARAARGAVVVIADRDVAALAHDVGVGELVEARLGGKVDGLHGAPIRIKATVLALTDGRYSTSGSWATGQSFDMGLTALLEMQGTRIVVTSNATPPFHREHLTSIGIEPSEERILVAKGAIAWRSAYGDDARKVIEVDAPGACPLNPWILPRQNQPETIVPAVTPRLEVVAAGRRSSVGGLLRNQRTKPGAGEAC